jgi:adenosylmethionine-8-amino-7-oxononanoate aminotransferase
MNLSERDRQLIWHPFTQHLTAQRNIAIVRGEGALLFDEDGNEYIDAISSWWTNLFGHANPVIAANIKDQLDTLEHVIFAGFTHSPAVQLAEKLLRLLPSNQSRLFFSDDGSTSVEVALKMAVQYWHNSQNPKTKFIAFQNSYHGDTFGAMSVGARGMFNRPFEEMLFDVQFIEVPDERNFNEVFKSFTELCAGAAAFIFEPLIQGSGGMHMYNPAHLDKLIEHAQSNDVLCIADEVMTGFGRTGKIFASDYLEHAPDIFCISKGITGGFLPLGITSCSQKIYEAFLHEDKWKTFFHGHSYTGNPLACAAAVATLELLVTSKQLIRGLVEMQAEYSKRIAGHAKVSNFRQLGTVTAFEVAGNDLPGYFNTIRDRLYEAFMAKGILLRPLGNTVYVMPPYNIQPQQLEKIYTAIEEVLNSLEQ